MDTEEKKSVLKVVKILGELASAWSHLPDDIQESTIKDLEILGMQSIRDLAQRLTSMTKGYDNYCEFCGNGFFAKRQSKRFCSTNCRVQWNNKKNYEAQMAKYEADKAASTW